MAVIKSGVSPDQLTIDPTSKAARVTQYDSEGRELFRVPVGSYIIPISMNRQTSSIAAGSEIWAFRNGASRVIRIRKICLVTAFDGTAAASTQVYQLLRFTGANPTGGTVISIIKKKTTFPASTVQDARQSPSAALGVAGITFETAGICISAPRQVGASQFIVIDFNQSNNTFELQPNEGLAIELQVAAVIGDSITGFIEFDEV